MHEQYVAAGVDIITTNTYASARHNLEPLGLGDKVVELNLRAVMLAQDARDRTARERPDGNAGGSARRVARGWLWACLPSAMKGTRSWFSQSARLAAE